MFHYFSSSPLSPSLSLLSSSSSSLFSSSLPPPSSFSDPLLLLSSFPYSSSHFFFILSFSPIFLPSSVQLLFFLVLRLCLKYIFLGTLLSFFFAVRVLAEFIIFSFSLRGRMRTTTLNPFFSCSEEFIVSDIYFFGSDNKIV